VIEADDAILAELERLAPADERASFDWEEVLRRAGVRTAPRSARRRWRLLVAVPALVLVVAAPTLALSAGVRSFLGLERPRPVVTEAELLVSASVGNAFYAHLWHSPSTTGGRCAFTTIDHRPVPPRVPTVNGASGCSFEGNRAIGRADKAHPLVVGMSIQRRPRSGVAANWVPPIVDGSVSPTLHAARVAVEWRGGSLRLTLGADGYFLGGSPELYIPPFALFPFHVVAYDASGREVARKKLDSPSLRLMNGWKEYTPAYNKWKKRQR
jgi:hypothetical protein